MSFWSDACTGRKTFTFFLLSVHTVCRRDGIARGQYLDYVLHSLNRKKRKRETLEEKTNKGVSETSCGLMLAIHHQLKTVSRYKKKLRKIHRYIGHKIQRVTKFFFLLLCVCVLLVYTKYKIFIEMIHTTHTHIRAYIHVNEQKK